MKRPGAYAPLHALYADDEKIMAAGEDAELLYVRMLAYAARTPRTDGWISDAVLRSRLGILPRTCGCPGNVPGNAPGNVPGNVPGTDPGSRAERLSEVGLIARVRDGWQINAWLKWNRSAAQIEGERESDRTRKKPLTSEDAVSGPVSGEVSGPVSGEVSGPVSEDQIQIQIQSMQKPPAKATGRKRPAAPIPSDWAPTETHREMAVNRNLDIEAEAAVFRAHAEANDRRVVRWDAAFTQWLIKARQGTSSRPKVNAAGYELPEAWR